MADTPVPVAILGAGGYVAGELLRWLSFHPNLHPVHCTSRSRSESKERIPEVFPHLTGVYDDLRFTGNDEVLAWVASASSPIGLFSCLPHGAAATTIASLMTCARQNDVILRVVDLSADFRLPTPEAFASTYGLEHPAPEEFAHFECGLPELSLGKVEGAVSHPGCFATAVTLACAPLVKSGLVEPQYRVSAVTGSTGSGRTPTGTTHHPERHGNLSAYKPLTHRHRPEMEMMLKRLMAPEESASPQVLFVPHSGPFARGIHATVMATLKPGADAGELRAHLNDLYREAPFVHVIEGTPKLKNVVGSNRCHLGIAIEGREVVVFSVIDNLVKGAAGGGVQWMNRLLGFDETTGLRAPALGWS